MGSSGIIWDRVILILVSLVVSPFLGLLTGYFFMFVTQRIVRLVKWDLDKADKFYKRMQILSAAWVSFSHGSNDATKVMGMIVLFLASSHQLTVDGYIDKFGFPSGSSCRRRQPWRSEPISTIDRCASFAPWVSASAIFTP